MDVIRFDKRHRQWYLHIATGWLPIDKPDLSKWKFATDTQNYTYYEKPKETKYKIVNSI